MSYENNFGTFLVLKKQWGLKEIALCEIVP